MALFKLSHIKFATEAACHEHAVSSPRCLPLCKSQGELISHLAPCLLASQPHQALIHVEQEQRVLISPQRCLKTCLLGLALGGAKMLEMKVFTLRFIHLPPLPQTASAFPEPCSPRGAACCPLGVALQTRCHAGGSCCYRDPTGEAAHEGTFKSVVQNPRETPQPVNISRLERAKT